MSKFDVHYHLLRDYVSSDIDDYSILMWMVLLHTHTITLKPSVHVDDVTRRSQDGTLLLPSVTRHHASEIISSLWPNKIPQGQSAYWYSKYLKYTPYELLSQLSVDELDQVNKLRATLLTHDWILAVNED